jgi:mannitol-specific phosphotransferase system IIBC component
MEEYLKNGINFKSQTFCNDFIDHHNSIISNYLENDTNAKDIISILNSLVIFATRTNEAISYFKNLELDITQDVEPGYNHIFKMMIEEISRMDNQLFKNNLDRIIKLINAFSVQPETEFKFDSISKIVYMIKENKFAKTLNSKQLSDLINSFKIKLNLIYFKVEENEDDEETELIRMKKYHNRANNQICSRWRLCLENFFDSFDEEEFIKNIDIFQNFYE